jgi:hypothetical protein
MDILAYLNKHYPHFVFSISSLCYESIKICTKETYDLKAKYLDSGYFKNVPVKIFYIGCPDDNPFWHVENKTVPYDMMQYYIEETERVLKLEIRKLKIKELYES